MKRLILCLKDRSGSSFPLIVAVTLSLLLILNGAMEAFRLNIIASGVRDVLQDAVIVTVNDNYANVYHGVREGYSGGYQPMGGNFEDSVDTGEIYRYMQRVLGTKLEKGTYVKYTGAVVEYKLSGLEVKVRNAPFAPANPESEQAFEADALLVLEVPVQFAGKKLTTMKINLKMQAGYTEVFGR